VTWEMTDEEWAARFTELPCCGHVAAVHNGGWCHSTAGMDPGEFCDCRKDEL